MECALEPAASVRKDGQDHCAINASATNGNESFTLCFPVIRMSKTIAFHETNSYLVILGWNCVRYYFIIIKTMFLDCF